MSSTPSDAVQPKTQYSTIVQKLADKLDSDAKFKADMQESFDKAASSGIREFNDYNIHSLSDYVDYLDKYLNWIPCETDTADNVYMHICMFYFVIDCLPVVREYQDPIVPLQPSLHRWLSDWLIQYAKEIGKWMDTPQSITADSINSFYDKPTDKTKYHMDDYPCPPGGWKSFNDFFARHIDPVKRPIAPGDDTVIVSPADCTYDGQWPVDESDSVTFCKGVPWSISELLHDTEHGSKFTGGVFTHSFLGPADYHRQHAPVSGKVVEAKIIPGLCYLEVKLTPDSSDDGKVKLGMHRYLRPKNDQAIPAEQRGGLPSDEPETEPEYESDLRAPDLPGYQFLQARGLILIDNPILGLVAVLPIGMAQVSSVVLSVQKGDDVKKGDEISCFQFGGSDIIMVFQKDANVEINQVLNQHYNFGTQVAVASPQRQ